MWILLIAVIILYVLFRNLNVFSSGNTGGVGSYETKDTIFNFRKVQKQKEIDYLLDKINKVGVDGLSPSERQRLDELTRQ